MNEPLPHITPENLNDLIGAPDGPVIIDVRKRPAFEASDSMIASAFWRNHEDVGDWANELPVDRDVVVYCVHGHEVSQGAAAALLSKGLRVRYLAGGFEDFRDAGGKLMPRIG